MYNFSKCEIMLSKYGYLMLPETFPSTVILDINFKDEVVIQCSSCRNIYAGAGNLQIITNKFSDEYLWNEGLTY